MDISAEYVQMCEQAGEIQALREYDTPYQDGDWWVSRRWTDAVPCAWRAYRGKDDVWLPRQDQLQILSNLSWKAFDIECQKYDMETKEQAGICVVMKCYNKRWSENEWIQP